MRSQIEIECRRAFDRGLSNSAIQRHLDRFVRRYLWCCNLVFYFDSNRIDDCIQVHYRHVMALALK